MDTPRYRLRNPDGSLSNLLTETDLISAAREASLAEETLVLDATTGRWRPAWTIEALLDSFGLRIPENLNDRPDTSPWIDSRVAEPATGLDLRTNERPSVSPALPDAEIEGLLHSHRSSGEISPRLKWGLIGGAILFSSTCLGVPVSLFFSMRQLPRLVSTQDQKMMLRVPPDWSQESPLPEEELRFTTDGGETLLTVRKTVALPGRITQIDQEAETLAEEFAASLPAPEKQNLGRVQNEGREQVQHELRWRGESGPRIALLATTRVRGSLYQLRGITASSIADVRLPQIRAALKSFREDLAGSETAVSVSGTR